MIPSPLANPMVIANVLIILIVIYSPLTLDQYLAGGNMITMFIGPVTVILALRIYRQRSLLTLQAFFGQSQSPANTAAAIQKSWDSLR